MMIILIYHHHDIIIIFLLLTIIIIVILIIIVVIIIFIIVITLYISTCMYVYIYIHERRTQSTYYSQWTWPKWVVPYWSCKFVLPCYVLEEGLGK